MLISLIASECPAAVDELKAAGMRVCSAAKPRGFGRVLGREGDGSPVHEDYWYDVDVEPA